MARHARRLPHGAPSSSASLALAAILVLRFAAPKVPGALVLVVGGLLASNAARSRRARRRHGGRRATRPAPAGAPGDLDLVRTNAATIGIAALAFVLIGFSQTAGDARVVRRPPPVPTSTSNQESVAQGMSNLGAGMFQGMPVSTSLSASSLNDASGARTRMASIVTGVMVVLTLLVLAPLFSDLPKPVLGADHHRRRRVRDDGRPRDASAVAGEAVRLLDRRGRDRRRAGVRCPGRASSSGWCCRWPGSST